VMLQQSAFEHSVVLSKRVWPRHDISGSLVGKVGASKLKKAESYGTRVISEKRITELL